MSIKSWGVSLPTVHSCMRVHAMHGTQRGAVRLQSHQELRHPSGRGYVEGHAGQTIVIAHLLFEDVIEAGRPLAAAETGGVRAVVHHECHAPSVHVRVQTVHRLDDGLVADFAVWVALHAAARGSRQGSVPPPPSSGSSFRFTDRSVCYCSGTRDKDAQLWHGYWVQERVRGGCA